MEISNMKKIVVLKNLPSNLVEEAIVVMKDIDLGKKLEFVNKKTEFTNEYIVNRPKDYIVKEAEMLVTNYISGLEKNKEVPNKNSIINMKYQRTRKLLFIIMSLLVISVILNII